MQYAPLLHLAEVAAQGMYSTEVAKSLDNINLINLVTESDTHIAR